MTYGKVPSAHERSRTSSLKEKEFLVLDETSPVDQQYHYKHTGTMAAKSVSQNLEEQVTCPICLEQYQDPRILPCLHTYCKHCLEKLLYKGTRRFSIQCPECREIAQVEGVRSLKVNIWVNKTISTLELSKAAEKTQDGGKKELMCNNCDSKEAAQARCFDCEKYMCNACINAHRRISSVKHHQLMTLEEIKNKGIPVVEKLKLCYKHKGKKQKLFCKKCEQLICKDCTLIDHKDHDFCFIDDIIERLKNKFTDGIKTASKTKAQLEASVEAIEKKEDSARKYDVETKKRINEAINKQVQALEEKRISLEQESTTMTATKMKMLSSQKESLMMHLTSLTSAIEFTQNVLAKGSNSEVLSVSKDITSRLSSLSTKPFDGEVKDQLTHVLLKVDCKVQEMLRDSIGKFSSVIDVVVTVPDPQQCEVVWPDDVPGCFIHIRNRFGESIDIDKNRIDIIYLDFFNANLLTTVTKRCMDCNR